MTKPRAFTEVKIVLSPPVVVELFTGTQLMAQKLSDKTAYNLRKKAPSAYAIVNTRGLVGSEGGTEVDGEVKKIPTTKGDQEYPTGSNEGSCEEPAAEDSSESESELLRTVDKTRGLSAYIARWLLELWQIL